MLRAFVTRSLVGVPRAPLFYKTFSTTRTLWGTSQVDADLANKLESEIQCEQVPEKQPKFVQDFLKKSAFKLHDTPLHDEVTLTRQHGKENIRVRFSISSINQGSLDEYYSPDDDEPVQEEEDALQVSFPVHAAVSIEKDAGALIFDTVATDGELIVEQVSFYKDRTLAMPESSEAHWKRLSSYTGPQFAELDEDLQDIFERFIQERGVDDDLAKFLPDYVEHKEQQEYLRWLHHVKGFVAAGP